MTVARRTIASAGSGLDGPGAQDLQRFANAGRLVAAMSDDLLRAIGMAHTDVGFLCELLPRSKPDDDSVRDAAVDARSSISRAAAGVASLLSLARPRQPQVAPVLVAEVVEAALFDLDSCLSGLSVERTLAPGILAMADRGALLQSLVSLLLDAADAAQPRGRIRIGARCEAAEVLLTVEDDGPSPLSPESLPERPNTPLWICRNVLRAFGADLSADTGTLGGRRVTVRLPAA